jgi:transcriptional regulator with XRE-family HTH domain
MLPSAKESRFDENEREFLGLTLARQIFGALYSAVQYRMESNGMTRADFGERTGRDKTGVSKLLRGPGNWTIQTISDVANALEVDVEFAFFDQRDQTRLFTATGMHHPSLVQNYSAIAPPMRYMEHPIAAVGNLSVSASGDVAGQPAPLMYCGGGTSTFSATSTALTINAFSTSYTGTSITSGYALDIGSTAGTLKIVGDND